MGKWLYALAASCALVPAINLPSANAQGDFPIADRVAGPIANKLFECGMIP